MTKKAASVKTVTKTSPRSKTIIRRPKPAAPSTGRTAPPARVRAGRGVKQAVTDAQVDKAESTAFPDRVSADAHASGDPAVHHAQGQAETRPAGVANPDADQVTLDQLNGQLAAIRGLPQYADLERDLTERIATLTASRA